MYSANQTHLKRLVNISGMKQLLTKNDLTVYFTKLFLKAHIGIRLAWRWFEHLKRLSADMCCTTGPKKDISLQCIQVILRNDTKAFFTQQVKVSQIRSFSSSVTKLCDLCGSINSTQRIESEIFISDLKRIHLWH